MIQKTWEQSNILSTSRDGWSSQTIFLGFCSSQTVFLGFCSCFRIRKGLLITCFQRCGELDSWKWFSVNESHYGALLKRVHFCGKRKCSFHGPQLPNAYLPMIQLFSFTRWYAMCRRVKGRTRAVTWLAMPFHHIIFAFGWLHELFSSGAWQSTEACVKGVARNFGSHETVHGNTPP